MKSREGQTTHRRKYHRYHRGLAFDLWSSRGVWFWHLRETRSGHAVIGATSSEAEATDAACATIDVGAEVTRTISGDWGEASLQPATTPYRQVSYLRIAL